jgi:hypothetical protein
MREYLIDGVVEAFRDGGTDALNAMRNGLSGFDLGSAIDALNPLNVFNWGGAPAPLARSSFAGESMLMAANAPASSDFSYNTRVGGGGMAAAGSGKFFNIERIELHADNDLDEMYSGLLNNLGIGR